MYFLEKNIQNLDIIDKLQNNFDLKSSMFFDIETSGLSPLTSQVFLIGLMFYNQDKFILRQYFANDQTEEIEILNNFIEDIKHFDILFHFNGLSFDIPYLNQRLKQHGIKYEIEKEKSFDIYQNIKKHNDFLNLESLKLKNIEKYMGIFREDELSGREIVETYNKFIENKDYNLRNYMLLHNEEDIINLYKILPIFKMIDNNYSLRFDKSKQDNTSIIINDLTFETQNILISGLNEKEFSSEVNNNSFMYTWFPETKKFVLKLKIFEGILYYHLKDYKNYYYIPEIDEVIHKSIIKYYNYDNKVPADKNNCYTKQLSKYIALPLSYKNNEIKLFSESPLGENNCITLDDFKKYFNKENICNLIKILF